MRATLFHNPTAGGKAFSKKNLLDSLRLAGFKVKYVSTKGRAFKTALKKESGLFVVAGGDGTITKILTGMKNRRVPVAIAPTGSANNIARSLGIHGTPQELVELWRSKHRMRLNIGSAQGMWGRRSFVESAGIGALAKFL